jgi:hypothetical protein
MNTSFTYSRLSKDKAACLLADRQSGLISLVRDFSPGELKNKLPDPATKTVLAGGTKAKCKQKQYNRLQVLRLLRHNGANSIFV